MNNGYDEEYFERGIQTGKSCYTDYRWIPDLTIPMAMAMIDFLGIQKNDTVLDFGCAKGYLVKAFRMLHRQAWGIDCSKYALSKVDEQVKNYCCGYLDDIPGYRSSVFDFCVAKDVFEHIPTKRLSIVLEDIRASVLFVVVPLGDTGKYVVPAYHMDKTHVICENEYWWQSFFAENRWTTVDFQYRVEGIKDNWSQFERGNAFYVLKRT